MRLAGHRLVGKLQAHGEPQSHSAYDCSYWSMRAAELQTVARKFKDMRQAGAAAAHPHPTQPAAAVPKAAPARGRGRWDSRQQQDSSDDEGPLPLAAAAAVSQAVQAVQGVADRAARMAARASARGLISGPHSESHYSMWTFRPLQLNTRFKKGRRQALSHLHMCFSDRYEP